MLNRTNLLISSSKMGQCISRWQVHSLKRRERLPSISRVSPVSPRNTHVSPVSPNLNHNKGRLYLLYLPESHCISRVSPVSPRTTSMRSRNVRPAYMQSCPDSRRLLRGLHFFPQHLVRFCGFPQPRPCEGGPSSAKGRGKQKKIARGPRGEREEGR